MTLPDPVSEKPRFLLVEDNRIALRTLENLVLQAACQFKSVMDAETAWTLLVVENFTLMITDLGLPQMSGIDLTQKLRDWEQANRIPALPVIGLTAHSREGIKRNCLEAGMNAVFTKPMTLEILHQLKQDYGPGSPLSAPQRNVSRSTTDIGLNIEAADAKLFHLNHLAVFDAQQALAKMGNDLTLFKNILKTLLQETPNDLLKLEQAHRQEDWQTVIIVLNRLKNGYIYCGAQKLIHACQLLERYHKTGHTNLLEQLYQQILQILDDTGRQLENWLITH